MPRKPLAAFVADEHQIDVDKIMLLKHSQKDVKLLRKIGADIEEFTALQATGSFQDFLRSENDKIEIVIVALAGRVLAVYRIEGILKEGAKKDICSIEYKQFEQERQHGTLDKSYRLFKLSALDSTAIGCELSNWGDRPVYARSLTPTFAQVLVHLPHHGGVLAEEIVDSKGVLEGAKSKIVVNSYERSSWARQRCIDHHGALCGICGFEFERFYGPSFRGFIHVHHLVPLSSIGEQYEVDPITELIPVCPNCHATIHHGGGCRTIAEMKALIADARKRRRS